MKKEDVIAAATEELNTSYENNALWFEVLINQAIRSHKTTAKFKAWHSHLKAYDNKATLPDSWVRIKALYLCSTGTPLCPDIDYCVQNNTIVFDSALGIVDGTIFDFHYVGLNTNEDGEIVIPDDWERMLVAYIGWKYTRRYIKDFGVAIMQNYQREYQTQKLANV
jgi:hypothetical protein